MKILIVDEHVLLRKGIRCVLEEISGVQAVADKQGSHLQALQRERADQHGEQRGVARVQAIDDGARQLFGAIELVDSGIEGIDPSRVLVLRQFRVLLLRAADRGVRIRLLLDDYRTGGHDAGLAALRSHPNFEFRIYNPFMRRSARY